MELAEIVMNPVRQRIFQYLLLHETGTVKEIRKALPDVPGASLYRHMKLLTENGIEESGTHEELVAKGGIYQKLCEMANLAQ